MMMKLFLAAALAMAAAPGLGAPAPSEFLPQGAATHLRNAEVKPIWLPGGGLAYRRDTPQGQAWVITDTAGKTRPAFDATLVAEGLSKVAGVAVKAGALPFETFAFVPGGAAIDVAVGPAVYRCSIAGSAGCTARPVAMVGTAPGVFSPDRRWIAYLKDGNLRVHAADGSADIALTSDAEPDWTYAGSTGNNTAAITLKRAGIVLPPNVRWSPDSRRILTHRIDERGVKPLSLLQNVPEDGSARPKLWIYRYSFPGEPKAMETLAVFDVPSGRRVDIKSPPAALPFTSTIEQFSAWWSEDGGKVYFLSRGPYYRTMALEAADAATGTVRTVVSESSASNIEPGLIGAPPLMRISGNDLVWYSTRDGFGHLYRYDLRSGRLVNRITGGPWMVRDVLRVDAAAGRIVFLASGREPGRNPYFRKVYSIGFDGRGLKLLTPEDADHVLYAYGALFPDPLGLGVAVDNISPDGAWLVDNFSAADTLPKSVLRRADGRVVATLGQAELTGFDVPRSEMPEPFVALAADGVTKLYGTLYRPAGFRPEGSYPLVDSIYAGPQMRRVEDSFAGTFFDRGGAMMLAQRGMVAITLDARGTPGRSEAFQKYGYGKLANPGLDDHVAVIRQLAERYKFIDTKRVGIFGVSGGGYAAARAMFTYPDVFRAGVSTSGNHDPRRYLAVWGESYDGPDPDGKLYAAASNAELAKNLKGKLLLIHGEMDDNVPPANTWSVVDALIKADKDFELLVVPNANHGAYHGDYVWRRTGDFLARELGAEAPPRP